MKRWLLTGLLIWIPLVITLWVVFAVVGLMDQTLLLLPAAWQPEALFGFAIPGLGVLLTALVLLLTGILAANFAGRWFFAWWNGLLERIPVVRSIYGSVKQLSDTLLAGDGQAFSEAVLVQFPGQGLWSVGLVTGEVPACLRPELGEDSVSVYIPAALSPTTGFTVVVPRSKLRPAHMSVDEALKYVVSMGVVVPTGGTEVQQLNG